MTRILKLRTTFGTNLDIKRAAVDTLWAAQSSFCDSLESYNPHETLGSSIIALSHTILGAT